MMIAIQSLCLKAVIYVCMAVYSSIPELPPEARPEFQAALHRAQTFPAVTIASGTNIFTITVMETMRPHYVFYEGAYRALLVESGGVVRYYPFPLISAGDQTSVSIYRCGEESLLLLDQSRDFERELILDLSTGHLFMRLLAPDDRYFTYSICQDPYTTLEGGMGSDQADGLPSSLYVEEGASSGSFFGGDGQEAKLTRPEYIGKGRLLGVIQKEKETPGVF